MNIPLQSSMLDMILLPCSGASHGLASYKDLLTAKISLDD